jgi:O-antigen/teichoic acid export membrane protein
MSMTSAKEFLRDDCGSAPNGTMVERESLASEAVRSTGWSAGFQITQQVFQLGISILLIRLLSPADFGLVAMANVIIGLAGLLGDLGLCSAIVQKKDLLHEHLDSIFWLNFGLGLIIFLVLTVTSPFAAAFYGEPRVAAIIVVSAMGFVLGPLSSVQMTVLRKELKFRTLGTRQFLAVLPASLISLWLAFTGWGAWSLVLGGLLSPLLMAFAFWNTVSWRPRLKFSFSRLRELMRFGLGLTGFSFFNYFTRNADNLLIGRYLGNVALGLYDRAYSLMLMPLTKVTRVLDASLFPVFSRLQDDNLRFQRAYIRVCRTVALVTLPMSVGFWVLLEPAIVVLYGRQWLGIVPLLQWLVPLGMVQSIGALVGHIYLAKGRTDWMLAWGVASGTLAVCSFIIGLKWGLLGVTIAYTVFSMLMFYPSHAIPFRLIQLPFLKWVRAWIEIALYAGLMGAVMYIVRLLGEQIGGHELSVLATSTLAGISVYFLIIRWRRPSEIDELRRAIPLERVAWLARLVEWMLPPRSVSESF